MFMKLKNSVSLVAVAPSFDTSKLDDSRRLKAGTGTVIEIPFQAHPMPSVAWKFKNGDLPDRKRFKEDTKTNMTSLSISKVSPSLLSFAVWSKSILVTENYLQHPTWIEPVVHLSYFTSGAHFIPGFRRRPCIQTYIHYLTTLALEIYHFIPFVSFRLINLTAEHTPAT